MGIAVLRECNCMEAVMKPCGKKKTGIQKLKGGPCVSQVDMNSRRRQQSSTQEFNGFRQGYATFPQFPGTFCVRKELYMSSMAADITTKPLMALPSVTRVL